MGLRQKAGERFTAITTWRFEFCIRGDTRYLGAKPRMNISAANSPGMDFAEFARPSAPQKSEEVNVTRAKPEAKSFPNVLYLASFFEDSFQDQQCTGKAKVKKHVQTDFRVQRY